MLSDGEVETSMSLSMLWQVQVQKWLVQIVAGAELKSLSPETENYHLLNVTVTSTRVQVWVPRPTRP